MTEVLALVTDAYGGQGGIAQASRDIVEALSAQDWVRSIQLLPRSADQPLPSLPKKVRQLDAIGNKFLYASAALIHALLRRPQIIFCNHMFMAPLAALAARACGAQLVIQLHGVEAWPTPTPARKWALEQAQMLICVSRFTRSQILKSIIIAPERAIVLSNTVDPRFNVEGREAARAKFGFGRDLTLLTVGRLDVRERYKGHDRVISILAQLQRGISRSIVYVIAGDGDDRSRLEMIAKAAGLANEVQFLGRVASADLPDLYRAVDLFVMPSTGEGFGIVFLEAMGCGTPALGLGVGGANDPLGDGLLGHVTSEADLLTGLHHALTLPQPNPNILSEKVQKRFGRQAFARATAGAISRLVETA